MKKFRDAKAEMERASKASLEFDDYKDKLRNKSSKKAFDECYDWFKKNDPNGLNEMMKVVKENVKGGGSKYDLVDVHGFKKAYEGYEDYQWSKDEKNWKNDPKYKELKEKSKSFDKAYNKYLKVCDDVSDKLLGQYGDYPYASKKFDTVYNGTITYNYKDLMSEVLSSYQFSDLIFK
jgi:hypothetical protein